MPFGGRIALSESSRCHFQDVLLESSSVLLPTSSELTSTTPFSRCGPLTLKRLSCSRPTYEVLANRAMATIV